MRCQKSKGDEAGPVEIKENGEGEDYFDVCLFFSCHPVPECELS
jgi:hypothetical protein